MKNPNKFPSVLYVIIDGDKGEEFFLASDSIDQQEGKIGVYKFVEEFKVRSQIQVRRPGTKTWFVPSHDNGK